MRITFVSPSAYPTLVPSGIAFAGGAEFQQVMLARALVRRGHEISFVVGDYGQAEFVDVDGIALHRSFELFEGNRKLRFIPDMWKLRTALRRSRPDIVYQRSTSFYTGQTCLFSHEIGAAFVFALGIDYNVHRDLMGRVPRLIRTWYRWGVENAELILAQTDSQAQLMQRNFKCSPVVLANMLEIPEMLPRMDEGEYVLWVGSMARRKRPELFVTLAKELPNQAFRMVGGPGEDHGHDSYVRSLAEGVQNLQISGFIPQHEMEDVYRKAVVFVNTSTLEGLPNTYLHAWAQGVPVLTVEVDPDGVIAEKGLGVVAGRADELRASLAGILTDTGERRKMAIACRDHVQRSHDIGVLSRRAEELFAGVMAR